MLDKRASGILMHISSLPGEYGIGTLGKAAKDFALFLRKCGFSYWQILPMGPTGEHNSPYQCYSVFAGNYYYIDLDLLKEDNLLTEEDLEKYKHTGDSYKTDFNWLKNDKLQLLKIAYNNIGVKLRNSIYRFVSRKYEWIKRYAAFMMLKNKYKGAAWYEWADEDKYFDSHKLNTFDEKVQKDIEFEYFCQYMFFKQWSELKQYVNALGIRIIGDMPMYAAYDSADVWSSPELFEISKDSSRKLQWVAGVPPDYFSEEGQLWGNPTYDWEVMEKTHYRWWLERFKNSFKMYDFVRVDHFRGFAKFWAIPAESKSAKDGKWVQGPGEDLFDALKHICRKLPIIAEDLGEITDDVKELLKYTRFPGMRVMQFAFLDDEDNLHLPHNYITNSVAYTGTHDNNTVLGWMWEGSPLQRERAINYCNIPNEQWGTGGKDSPACKAWIRTLLSSKSVLAIVPIQDLCGFGADTRMNIPGIAEENWTFRITGEYIDNIDIDWIKKMNSTFKRNIFEN